MKHSITANYDALVWLQDELQATFKQTLDAVNSYIDNHGGKDFLNNAIDSLIQIDASLDMLSLNGAALLTSEIQNNIILLRDNESNDEKIQDSIINALLILPSYIKQLSDECPDHPLTLLDEINSLRLARNDNTLDAIALFSPSLSVALPEIIAPNPNREIPDIKLEKLKIPYAFQHLLLRWLKHNESQSISKMWGLIFYLRVSSQQDRTCLFWWISEVFFQALAKGRLTSDNVNKRLVKELVEPVKIVTTEGEDAFLVMLPESLEKKLLLQIAKITIPAPQELLLKNTFQLTFFDNSNKLHGMSNNALEDAYLALLEQVQTIQVELQQHEHIDQLTTDFLISTKTQCQQVAETLSVLNAYEASHQLYHQVEAIEAAITEGDLLSQRQIDELADTLLQIENHIRSQTSASAEDELRESVINECLLELVNIKENLTLMSQTQSYQHGLEETCQKLPLLSGSLSLLNLPQAANILQQTADIIQPFTLGQKDFGEKHLQRLAEILACCDIYMEGIQQHAHANNDYLDNAEQLLSEFNSPSTSPENIDAAIQEEPIDTPTSLPVQTNTDANIDIQFAEGIDPEIAQLFLEECHEILDRLNEIVPSWSENNKIDLLQEIRRHFHTIKGAGRLAGANVIAELAWSVEDILNQVLENTLELSTQVVELVTRSVQLLPELLDRFKHADLNEPDEITTLLELKQHCITPPETVESEKVVDNESTSRTSVSEYIYQQSLSEPVDDTVQNTPTTNQPFSSVDQYLVKQRQNKTSVAKYLVKNRVKNEVGADESESSRHLPNNTISSVDRFLIKANLQNTSVDRYIEQLQVIKTSAPVENKNDAIVQPLTGVEKYLVAKAQSDTKVAQYITAEDEAATVLTENIDAPTNDDLMCIFESEALQHLSSLKQSLQQLNITDQIPNQILRSAHSLKACTLAANVEPMLDVTTDLDTVVKHLYANDILLDKGQIQQLTDIVNGLESILQHVSIDNEKSKLSEISSSINNIISNDDVKGNAQTIIDPELLVVLLEETDELLEQYVDKLKHWQNDSTDLENKSSLNKILHRLEQTASAAKQTALAEIYRGINKLVSQFSPEADGLNQLLHQGYQQLHQIIESLLDNKTIEFESSFSSQADEFIRQHDETQADKSIHIDETQFAIPSDVDPELLSAFAEEAAELLNSSGQSIKGWLIEQDNQQDALQLQRDLHTLKGGARLTGIQPMADLTHQTETLVLAVCNQTHEINEDFFDLLQRCQDKLTEMQEQLISGQYVTTALSLIAEITMLIKGEEVNIENAPIPNPEKIETSTSTEKALDELPTLKETSTRSKPATVEQVRVRADLLDYLTNFAGEVNISRDRVGQQHTALKQYLSELQQTINRLQDQLRKLELETETQILFRYEDEKKHQNDEFDPLELDRFSLIHQLSKGLTESVIDLTDLGQSMETLTRDTDAILLQQSRLSDDLHQGLMTTRLLPFTGLVPRLERKVRQTASELSKKVSIQISGADLDIDRTILDRLVAPIEHILTNAISHGIEFPDERINNGKTSDGHLEINLERDGSEIVISIQDDGRGIDTAKVREKAIAMQLISPEASMSDDEINQLILTSGFSTANEVSQLAGRGVGMDVVRNEIHSLKGRLNIQSTLGQGTTFVIRLPLTLSVIQALLVRIGNEHYALPLSHIHVGERISVRDIKYALGAETPQYKLGDKVFDFIPLSTLLNKPLTLSENLKEQLPLLLFRSGDIQVALLVDEIISNREIVIKPVGKQLSSIRALNGATILGDGRIVFILDIPTLIDSYQPAQNNSDELPISSEVEFNPSQPLAMIVDDSITMRKASSNLLKRLGFRVITARDGVDALSQLYKLTPDIILLDVEMPKMDGFEFASIVRNDERFSLLPIIMITSRTGEKHRNRAHEIGVNAYLGKPYQERELIDNMENLLGIEITNQQ